MVEQTAIDLNPLLGRSAADVLNVLREQGVKAEAAPEATAGPLRMFMALQPSPPVRAGAVVRVHTVGDRVVRLVVDEAASARTEAAAERDRVAALEQRMAALEDELRRLREEVTRDRGRTRGRTQPGTAR